VNSFSKVVLLVDDSATVRRMLEWSLKPSGFRTLQAADGVHALELLKVQSVDLAIVDLNMPRMDGIELIRSIRADEKLKKLPVILLTTEKREVDRASALDAGANLYLTKPAAPDVLRRQVEGFLGVGGPAGGGPQAVNS
jgi:two-component system chemotaxis response regulator CheY